MTPILYVKKGCPYCKAAMDYLDQRNISYTEVDVRGDDAKMKKLQDLSGQKKTPTMDWDGDVLADFGTEELEEFLKDRSAAQERE
jgi:glutaredoxin